MYIVKRALQTPAVDVVDLMTPGPQYEKKKKKKKKKECSRRLTESNGQ